jgi:hypothetical protein
MEQGFLLDFNNPSLKRSHLLWITLTYLVVMIRISPENWVSILVNISSMILQWQVLLAFEDSLISVSKFVEGKHNSFSTTAFESSAKFLGKLSYIGENQVRHNCKKSLRETSRKGKFDLATIAEPLEGPLPDRIDDGVEWPSHSAYFVMFYLLERRLHFVDEEDNEFSHKIHVLLQAMSAMGIAFGGVMLYMSFKSQIALF